jgi:hypothetical protein
MTHRMRKVFRTSEPLRTGHEAADPHWRAEIYFSNGRWTFGNVGTRRQLSAAAMWCDERNREAKR